MQSVCSTCSQEMVNSIHGELNRIGQISSSPGQKPDFLKMFQSFDSDGSGEMTMDEFTESLQAMGFTMNSKRSKQMRVVFDTDDSGSINADEFVTFCEAKDMGAEVRKTQNALRKANEKKEREKEEKKARRAQRAADKAAAQEKDAAEARNRAIIEKMNAAKGGKKKK